jgi:hypothetical protein
LCYDSSSPHNLIHYLSRGDYVSPKILIDLEGHSTCKFETFLKIFLLLCLDGKKAKAPPDLLKKCVEAVIPICNAHTEPDEGTKRTKEKGRDYAAEIQDHLKD